jgi:hypothetical protein
LSETDLRRWLSLREREGDGVATGVAWSGLDVLARRQGPERTRNFLKAALANQTPKDVRALWFERRNSVETQLETLAGMPMATFIAAWRAELDSARAALKSDLARLPRVRGEVWFDALSAETRAARYRVSLDPAPETAASRVTLLHANLSAFETTVRQQDLHREDVDAASSAAGELVGAWSRGGRLYWTFSMELSDLGCEVISGWNRREIE